MLQACRVYVAGSDSPSLARHSTEPALGGEHSPFRSTWQDGFGLYGPSRGRKGTAGPILGGVGNTAGGSTGQLFLSTPLAGLAEFRCGLLLPLFDFLTQHLDGNFQLNILARRPFPRLRPLDGVGYRSVELHVLTR